MQTKIHKILLVGLLLVVLTIGTVAPDTNNPNLLVQNIDIKPPASISDLKNKTYAMIYINWTWKDPLDTDFSKVMIYINGKFKTNVTKGKRYYNATGLMPNTLYKISTHTVDISGNINKTWVNKMTRTANVYTPQLNTSWQWQLTGVVNQSYNVKMYDIDMFDNNASIVASLHAKGRKVICYISTGSWEDWRPDAYKFPGFVLGNPLEGWEGERWLDIRRIDIIGPIMKARMDLCKKKGFDGLEPDNVDGYLADTGFPLTYDDQIKYNKFLSKEAHARGLSIGLKNDIYQMDDLLPYFDWTLNEECFHYEECENLTKFINGSKAVFQVEYFLNTNGFCPQANKMNFNSMKKHWNLDAWRKPCRGP